MTRLTIDLPDNLHKTLKSLSVVDGSSLRNIAISAIEKYIQKRVNYNKSSISESDADNLLQPILTQYAQQIEDGTFEGHSWGDVKKEVQ